MIEEFKDELGGLKNILNEIKKTGKWKWNKKWNSIKNEIKMKQKETEICWIMKQTILRKVRCKFNGFRTKIYIS